MEKATEYAYEVRITLPLASSQEEADDQADHQQDLIRDFILGHLGGEIVDSTVYTY